MMTKLLRKLTHDVPVLNENTVVPLRVGSLPLYLLYMLYGKSFFYLYVQTYLVFNFRC